MKLLSYLSLILAIGLISCNPQVDFRKVIPNEVDEFATDYISLVQSGKIDSCLTLNESEINKDSIKQVLNNTYSSISNFNLDSSRIVKARKTKTSGDYEFSNYKIDYEYFVGDKFLYFTVGIQEQFNKLIINGFESKLLDESLANDYAFTLHEKGFLHYLFLALTILIPIFIIVTLSFMVKANLSTKGLWVLGALFGFIKFSINWTTGQVGFYLINISLLGAGFSKSGIIAPWIISFSIPVVAILFWINQFFNKKN